MARKDILGRAGEDRAVRYLTSAGWRVLDRNWRCRTGELDIVACDTTELVVVEVKTRTSTAFGHPLEAITPTKLARLRALSREWLAAERASGGGRLVGITGVRIDAIAIVGVDPERAEVEHVRGIG